MSSAEPVTFVDLAESIATTPVIVAAPIDSTSSVRSLTASVLRKDSAEGTRERGPNLDAKGSSLSFKGFEVRAALGSVPWGSEEPQVKAYMDQLAETQAEVRELARKIDAMAHDVRVLIPTLTAPVSDPAESPISDEMLIAAGAEELAQLLDLIADGHLRAPPAALELATQGLQAKDSELRAASARILSRLDAARARELLPKAMEREDDAFAMAVIRGALRAAT